MQIDSALQFLGLTILKNGQQLYTLTTPQGIDLTEREWPIELYPQLREVGRLHLDADDAGVLASGWVDFHAPLQGVTGRETRLFRFGLAAAAAPVGAPPPPPPPTLDIKAFLGVDDPATDVSAGVAQAAADLQRAGLPAAVTWHVAPGQHLAPNPPIQDPREAWDLTEMHALLDLLLTPGEKARPSWAAQLLVLSSERSDPERLLGASFDYSSALPRSGAAVFGEALRKESSTSFQQRLAHATLHGIGHTLNLVHRYDRAVGMVASASAMNDPGIYGKETGEDFWAESACFDRDEERFLRLPGLHAMPGGSPFHSAEYWREAGAPWFSALLPGDGALTLTAPRNGRALPLGQPVFLQVRFENTTAAPVPEWYLDPKAGLLELLIRRAGAPWREPVTQVFRPIARRCYSDRALDGGDIQPRHAATNNVNLTFGVDGFTFGEPGSYDIRAVLNLPAQDRVIASVPLRLRVVAPAGREAEKDLAALFDDDLGFYFALGGSRVVVAAPGAQRAEEKALAILERRWSGNGPVRDGTAAAILRCQALDALRDYPKWDTHAGQLVRDGADPERARQLLDYLDPAALSCFDEDTGQQAARLSRDLCQKTAPASRAQAQSWGASGEWGVLVYMAADSPDLRLPSESDLNELARGARGAHPTRVAVQIDAFGDGPTNRYAFDGQQFVPQQVQRGEANSGDPRSLRGFIEAERELWGLLPHTPPPQADPASDSRPRTLLVLWGHSLGVGLGLEPVPTLPPQSGAKDFGFDATNDDALTSWELAAVLNSVAGHGRPKIDLLGFDSCFMASAEIAYQLRDSVACLLAPQTSISFAGWNYERVLDILAGNPGIEPARLARRIVAEVGRRGDAPQALSALDLQQAEGLHSSLRALVKALRRAVRQRRERTRVVFAFSQAQSSGIRQFLDVVDLCGSLVNHCLDATVRARAEDLRRFLEPGVHADTARPGAGASRERSFVMDRRSSNSERLNGVSIFCPWFRASSAAAPSGSRNVDVDESEYRALDLPLTTGWADLMYDPILVRDARRLAARLPSMLPTEVSALIAMAARSAGAGRDGDQTKPPGKDGDQTKPPGKDGDQTKPPGKAAAELLDLLRGL